MQSLDIFNLNTKISTRVIRNIFIEALEEKSLKSGKMQLDLNTTVLITST